MERIRQTIATLSYSLLKTTKASEDRAELRDLVLCVCPPACARVLLV